MTELDIINEMRSTMGLNYLNEINEDDDPEVSTCRKIISSENIKIQKVGWWFNREYVDLIPDAGSKFIYVPADALSVNPLPKPPRLPVVQRGRRLYDTDLNTYKFDKEVEAEIIRLIPLEEIPVSAFMVVSLSSVMKYQQSYDADRSKMEQIQREMMSLTMQLNADHVRFSKVNIKHNNQYLYNLNRVRSRGRFY